MAENVNDDHDHGLCLAIGECDRRLASLQPRTLAFVLSRAEREGRSATSIVEEALSAYGLGRPEF